MKKEVAVGLLTVMLLELNADFVTFTAPTPLW